MENNSDDFLNTQEQEALFDKAITSITIFLKKRAEKAKDVYFKNKDSKDNKKVDNLSKKFLEAARDYYYFLKLVRLSCDLAEDNMAMQKLLEHEEKLSSIFDTKQKKDSSVN
jgi:hypothetical protein